MFKLLSFLFHPFYFLLLGVFVLYTSPTYINFSTLKQIKILVYSVILLNTMVLPALIAGYLNRRGRITSLYLESINDRKLMYLITFGFYLATLFILSSFKINIYVFRFTLGASLTVAALFILALFQKKVSAHLSAIGGLCGALVMLSIKLPADFLNLIVVFILLAGLIGTARIHEKAHKENEVYWGFLLGFFIQIFIFY
ncbi:MAG: hypothetical protein RIC15_10825 [Vicingaceae bacterium]